MKRDATLCNVTVAGADGAVIAEAAMLGPGNPDLEALDVLSLLALHARRRGIALVLAGGTPALLALAEMSGLAGEMVGEAERGEQTLRVEQGQEEAHLGDLPA
jgi:hypothetical protein